MESFVFARDWDLGLVLVWGVSAGTPAVLSEVVRADRLVGADGPVVKMELAVSLFILSSILGRERDSPLR